MGEAIATANEELVHGYTYSGHPVASAVALKNLEIIEREGLVGRVGSEIGPYLHRRMREAFEGHPIVGQVRGFGLLCAIELVPDARERSFFPDPGNVGTHCRNYCFDSGLIMRAIRDTMVCAPPLTVSEAEIDELVAKAKDAIVPHAKDYREAVNLTSPLWGGRKSVERSETVFRVGATPSLQKTALTLEACDARYEDRRH